MHRNNHLKQIPRAEHQQKMKSTFTRQLTARRQNTTHHKKRGREEQPHRASQNNNNNNQYKFKSRGKNNMRFSTSYCILRAMSSFPAIYSSFYIELSLLGSLHLFLHRESHHSNSCQCDHHAHARGRVPSSWVFTILGGALLRGRGLGGFHGGSISG